MPQKEKSDTMTAQIHSLVEKHFESSDEGESDESDKEDDLPQGARGLAINKLQPAKVIGGQRRTHKKKNKKPQASG